ncbi:MAG: hypothetical protein DRJ38_03610 [Thermoprotei archaeon]|nr:MAG: hypothetical protein DRJ38_03610 [Thermoprotei archaeon]
MGWDGKSTSDSRARSEEGYKDYPTLPRWVFEVLPEKWRSMLEKGRAIIVRDPRRGYVICTWMAGEMKCWKILRKFSARGLQVLAVLQHGCATVSDVARLLGLDYYTTYRYISYYYYASLLTREGPYFCINYEHPQINYLLSRINTSLFFRITIGNNWLQYVTMRTGSSVNKEVNKNQRGDHSFEEVLRRIEEYLGRSLDENERRVVEALYRLKERSGSWYVRQGDPYSIREALGLEDMPINVFEDIWRFLVNKNIVWCHERFRKCRLSRRFLGGK